MMDNHDEFEDAPSGAPSPSGEIRHGVRHLARDVMTLTELQASLLQVELRNWLQRVAMPALIFGVGAAVVALASLPILLLSFAYWLVEAAALSMPLALLAAGALGLAIAVLCGLIAWQRIRRSHGAFTRFRLEFTRNVRWLKQILSRPTAVADPFSSDSYVPDAAPVRPR